MADLGETLDARAALAEWRSYVATRRAAGEPIDDDWLDDDEDNPNDPDRFSNVEPAIDELKRLNHWVCWKYVKRGEGKPTKPPCSAHTGFGTDITNGSNWASFEQATATARAHNLAGVGFVLSDSDEYTGVDLDACRDAETGVVEPWAQAIIDMAETYTEISPSGAGLRLIVRGKIDRSYKSDKARVEIYASQRYLTITGNHVEGTPGDIREAPQTIAALLARIEECKDHADKARDRREQERAKAAPPPKFERSTGERERAWAQAALEGVASELASVCEGGRNHALNAAAYRMGRIIARGWIDESSSRAALEDACRQNGLWKSDGPRGVRATLNSGLRGGLANPHEDLEDTENLDELDRMGDEIAAQLERAADGTVYDKETGEVFEEAPKTENSSNRTDTGGAKSPPPAIQACPYSWTDPTEIEPREWLFGRHLIRGFISATVSPGGIGKSSLLMAEAISMISGRALLNGIAPEGALNVWIINLEDPITELERRIAAALKHYGIKRADCLGKLFANSGRDTRVIIAESNGKGITINKPIVEAITKTIVENRIDVVIVDPFVASHRVNENDNGAIDDVARQWSAIAEKTGCAIELVHHVKKLAEGEVTVEMARGASAMISATRSARAINRMTSAEAARAGLESCNGFFRTTDGKQNMAPASEKSDWFQIVSVDLGNRGPFRSGDSIGVVTSWAWPDPLEDVSVHDLEAVVRRVREGRWRESSQARDWVGNAVADALGLDISEKHVAAKVKALLKIWIQNGALKIVEEPDEARRMRKFVVAGSSSDGGE